VGQDAEAFQPRPQDLARVREARAVLRVGLDIVGVDSAVQPILYGLIVILAIAATVDRRRTLVVA